MVSPSVPPYFELGWSILSSIGLILSIVAILVIGILRVTRASLLPLILSASGAVANGMCYVAFYTDASTRSRITAGVFADITWLIQEAGLSLYSYYVLENLLRGKERVVFLTVFWFIMLAILGIRMVILLFRAFSIAHNNNDMLDTINYLHVGYFFAIAMVESWSSFFLLRVLVAARRISLSKSNRDHTWHHLVRSTELRLATLAIIGIMRSCAYPFIDTAQKVDNLASQIDRFAYVLECMFPIVMMIDLVASKLPSQYQTKTAAIIHEREPLSGHSNHSHSHSNSNSHRSASITELQVYDESKIYLRTDHVQHLGFAPSKHPPL